MSDEIRFSEFPETKEMKQESVIPIVQSGKNMKIAFANFAKWIGISEEKIAQAVEAYLKENSLETGATQEQVAQINENTLAIDRLYKAVSEKEDAGTAESKVSSHNTSTDSHNDIRLLLQNTINTLNAFLDADEETLNQASEMIAYMKDNRGLIEQVTTNKVSVSDIVDNYTTNVSNKPVSAAVAVKLKALIDAIIVPTQLAQLAGDATHRTVTDAEKESWNNKSNFSGSYNDLDDKPDIPSLTGYATENYVKDYAQPKGNYLTEHQDISGYAKKATTLSGYGITDGATKKEVGQLSEQIVDLSVIITPQMYGAVGDGVTDDTVAFESALAENNNVFVPQGKYVISKPLDLTYHKSLYSNVGQPATIIYKGGATSNSVVLIGRLSIFRNINIEVKAPFNGTVFDTNNLNMKSSINGKHSRVEHIRVSFDIECTEATLIGIAVDSGADVNNMPVNTGNCYQVFNDIVVDSGVYYGTGIKMTLIQGRAFTEETKLGFPWLTHISYNDIYLGCPYTAIKAGVENTSGSELFERISMGHILFNNVSAQYIGMDTTRYFFDVSHISAFLTKCIGWDYGAITNNGEKVNIIGEGTNLSFNDCQMAFGQELLKCCDFTAETELTVEENPEYFINKYFKGSFLRDGYDSVNAKIDVKMAGSYIGDIAEEKINEVLYSGYVNILESPSTQYKMGVRYSDSAQAWKVQASQMAIIIPIVKGGNIIRWTPHTYTLSKGYQSMFFFDNDELTEGIFIGNHEDMLVSNETDTYLLIDNPLGYKYLSIPFNKADVSSETMIMTINQKIIDGVGQSYMDYLEKSVINPIVSMKIAEEVGDLSIPTKTSQLTNDSGFITLNDIPGSQTPDLSGYAKKSDAETWTFTLADGSIVTKKVVLA